MRGKRSASEGARRQIALRACNGIVVELGTVSAMKRRGRRRTAMDKGGGDFSLRAEKSADGTAAFGAAAGGVAGQSVAAFCAAVGGEEEIALVGEPGGAPGAQDSGGQAHCGN